MGSLTFEQVRERIKRNMPDQARSDAKRQKRLMWDRETAQTLIDSTHTYRIFKQEDPTNPGLFGYSVQLTATAHHPPRHLCGPLLSAADAREAAQLHADGIPLQANLT